MELIIEIINRSGRMLERRKLSGETISIGRGYDNCLILDDLSVNPHHASIEISDDHDFLVRDLGSANGLLHKGENVKGSAALDSGDEFVLGKTHLRIYRVDHPVKRTVSLDSVDEAVNFFSRNLVVLAATLLAISLIALGVWNETISEFKAQEFIETIAALFVLALAVALFWGLIGRVVKHEMFFKTQLSLILLYIAIASCIQFFYHVILFNTMSYTITTCIYMFVECVFLATLFWLNLRIATNQANPQRWMSTGMLSASIVLFSFSAEFFDRMNISESPYFISVLMPPSLRITSGVSLENFLQKGELIYSHNLQEQSLVEN